MISTAPNGFRGMGASRSDENRFPRFLKSLVLPREFMLDLSQSISYQGYGFVS